MEPRKEFTFVLTLEEIDIALTGLGELKASISMGVIQKIHDQVRPQVEKTTNPSAEAEEIDKKKEK